MAFSPEAARASAQRHAEAWSAHDPEAVAAFYAPQDRITINDGEPIAGRTALAELAAGFCSEFPDPEVRLDTFRPVGRHALFLWTLEDTHHETGNRVNVPGREERTLSDDGEVTASLGWFDKTEYARQIAEGA